MDGNYMSYVPPHGSNIVVAFGDLQYYSIGVHSDKDCVNFAADALISTKWLVDTRASAECLYMQTAGWADWKIAKISGTCLG